MLCFALFVCFGVEIINHEKLIDEGVCCFHGDGNYGERVIMVRVARADRGGNAYS